MQLEIPHQAVFPAHNLDFFGCRLELFRAISLFDISVDDNAESTVAKAEYSSFLQLFAMTIVPWHCFFFLSIQ